LEPLCPLYIFGVKPRMEGPFGPFDSKIQLMLPL